MKIELPYGKEKRCFEVQDEFFIGILDPEPVIPKADVTKLVFEAIQSPIGTSRLQDMNLKGKRIAIIVDDMSRPTPIRNILPVLMKTLSECGVHDKNIKIIVALGSHRYMTETELSERVGADIYARYQVINSEFRKPERLVHVGEAPDGVEIYATREVIEADVRIGIGNIVPHPVMGFSGGGKIFYPGISGESTVSYFHLKASLIDENMFGSDYFPIRQMMEQWVDVVGLDFIINTIMNSHSEVCYVVAGHYIKAHREGVKLAQKALGHKVTKKANVIVSSAYPADQDFWQSPKGMYAAEPALCGEKGTIILLTPNYEGIGPHKELPMYMSADNGDEIIRGILAGGNFTGDPLAIAIGNNMSKLRRRQQLVVVSDGVTKEEMEACGCIHYPSNQLQQAVDDAIAQYQNCKVAALSCGAETFLYR